MATCNVARWLRPQLASIASQSRLPDELVVVDDASTDETSVLLQDFARQAPFTVRRFENSTRRGTNATFERALGYADADVIALADHDDVWAPVKLARMAAEFDHNPKLLCAFSDAQLIDATGCALGRRLWETRGFSAGADHIFLEDLLGNSWVTGCTAMIRSSLLNVGLPLPPLLDSADHPMFHDRWLSLTAAAMGPVAAVDLPLVNYRVHTDQQSGLRRPARLGSTMVDRAVTGRWADDRKRVIASHLMEAQQTAVLSDRVTQVAPGPGSRGPVDQSAADLLEEFGRHLRRRAALPSGRARRLVPVSSELGRGSYHRFAGGVPSALADLVRL